MRRISAAVVTITGRRAPASRAPRCSMPTRTARATMLWPMLSSSMSGIAAIGADVVERQAVTGVDDQPERAAARAAAARSARQLRARPPPSAASA